MPQLSGPMAVQTLCDYKNQVDACTGVLYCNFSCQIHSKISFSKISTLDSMVFKTLLGAVCSGIAMFMCSMIICGHTLILDSVYSAGQVISIDYYD
jgi:hypothetical protein